jgi:hypothetical protein
MNDDKVLKRKRYRSNTVSSGRDITDFNKKYDRSANERRTKSASAISLTINSKQENEDYGLYLSTRTLPSLKTKNRRSSGHETSCSFGSLKMIKQRRDSGLRSLFRQDWSMDPSRMLSDDMGLGNDHHNDIVPSYHGTSESNLSSKSSNLDLPHHDNEVTDGNSLDFNDFAAEDSLHLDDSIRMSQLRPEKTVTFFIDNLLHDSIQRDDLDELCDLLQKNKELDLEKPNSFGITPLHRAAIDGGYRCLNFLLSRNVNVKVRDMYGWTPLHDAVYHGNIRCAAALITAGSDVETETNDFIKPIEMAPDDDMLLLIGRAMTSPGYVYDPDRETLV